METKQKELMDLRKEEHTKEQIIQEAQKLCSYILGLTSVKAEEVIDNQKLNHKNPVHLMGLAGTFISDIFIRDWKIMNDKLIAMEKAVEKEKGLIKND
jgi:hypothetical protein